MAAVHLQPGFYSAADRVLAGSVLDRPVDMEEVVGLAEDVLGWSPRVMRLQEQPQPVALADSGSGRIAFSPSSMVLSTVLHEVAHLMVGVEHRHDAVFLDAFCGLVEQHGSAALAGRLRLATTALTLPLQSSRCRAFEGEREAC